MNKKPVSYLQTDARWKNKPYQVPGETATIGGSGCGPACAAMVIATLADKSVTPVETCAWSVAHGYKALNQGTYYSYFKPQMAAYGIECKQLLSSRIINQPNHPIHDQVKDYLAKGYYVIALMGPGTWTRSGHFVLLWGWDDKVRINDPASTKDKRLNGDPATFRNEARCYWLVDARQHNKEDDDMDQERFNDMFKTAMQSYRNELRDNDSGNWSQEAREFAISEGIFEGATSADGKPNYMWEDFLTREQCAQVLYRFAHKYGLVK